MDKKTADIMRIPSTCLILLGLILIISLVGLSACQADAGPGDSPDTAATEPSSQQPDAGGNVTDEPDNGNGEPDDADGIETPPPDFEALWASSPHADTFVLDADGANSTCARCHAPIVWMPSLEDMPESCSACKFDVEDPPPLIPEGDWRPVECMVCHEVSRRGEVQPEVLWLEIAAIEEYAEVSSNTELCLKCHTVGAIPGHAPIQVSGAHADSACTDCHDAHATTSSCSAAGCHDDLADAAPTAGHDEAHQVVTCVACHDAGGLGVGPDMQQEGMWVTFFVREETDERIPVVSHAIQRPVDCARCHFTDNPWGLSSEVEP